MKIVICQNQRLRPLNHRLHSLITGTNPPTLHMLSNQRKTHTNRFWGSQWILIIIMVLGATVIADMEVIRIQLAIATVRRAMEMSTTERGTVLRATEIHINLYLIRTKFKIITKNKWKKKWINSIAKLSMARNCSKDFHTFVQFWKTPSVTGLSECYQRVKILNITSGRWSARFNSVNKFIILFGRPYPLYPDSAKNTLWQVSF